MLSARPIIKRLIVHIHSPCAERINLPVSLLLNSNAFTALQALFRAATLIWHTTRWLHVFKESQEIFPGSVFLCNQWTVFNVNCRSHEWFTKACYKDETLFDMLKNWIYDSHVMILKFFRTLKAFAYALCDHFIQCLIKRASTGTALSKAHTANTPIQSYQKYGNHFYTILTAPTQTQKQNMAPCSATLPTDHRAQARKVKGWTSQPRPSTLGCLPNLETHITLHQPRISSNPASTLLKSIPIPENLSSSWNTKSADQLQCWHPLHQYRLSVAGSFRFAIQKLVWEQVWRSSRQSEKTCWHRVFLGNFVRGGTTKEDEREQDGILKRFRMLRGSCSCCWEALCRKSNRAETDWIWKLGRGWRGLEAFRRRLVSLLYPFSKEEIFGETMYCSWEAMWLLET